MRTTFFGGKGGVGKTTCAAAAAVRAAAEGARVLVVSTDPAHSLGDALAAKLGPEPARVGRARGVLCAAQLDADRALRRWLDVREGAFRTIAERGTYLDDEDVDRLLALSLPGVDELVGLIELRRLAGLRPWDHVVVDTAPTGHTLRLLEMPETLRRFAEVLDDMHEKHRFLAASLGGRYRGDFADEVISELEADATELQAMLTDRSRAGFTFVTQLEALSIEESEDGVAALAALGVDVQIVVANRVRPPPDRPCTTCTPRYAAESALRARLADAFRDRSLLEIPAATVEPRGPAALLSLACSVAELGRADRRRRPGRAPSPSLAASGAPSPLPFDERAELVLFGGKGGVGKTTVAAACALDLARRTPDRRIMLLSIDPAHSLGDVLRCPLDDEPRRVPGAPKNLAAREIDPPRAFASVRDRYRASIDDLFGSLFAGRMDASFDRRVLEDLFDLAPPGLDELVAILSITDSLAGDSRDSRDRWDAILVDTAPTGHTLRLLDLPEAALEWVHALMKIVLKYRSVIGLGELASDLVLLARRLRELIARLSDPRRSAFVAVTRPSELPRLETERLVRRLRSLDVPVAAIVVNAIATGDCGRCRAVAASEAPELERLARLARTHSSARALVTAPAVFPPPSGPEELRLLRSSFRTLGRRAKRRRE